MRIGDAVIPLTFSGGLHATSGVDSVSEETISRHLQSDYSCNHWTRVNSNANLQRLIRTMANLERSHPLSDTQRHTRNLRSVSGIRHRNSARHHVGVAYRLNLTQNTTTLCISIHPKVLELQ